MKQIETFQTRVPICRHGGHAGKIWFVVYNKPQVVCSIATTRTHKPRCWGTQYVWHLSTHEKLHNMTLRVQHARISVWNRRRYRYEKEDLVHQSLRTNPWLAGCVEFKRRPFCRITNQKNGFTYPFGLAMWTRQSIYEGTCIHTECTYRPWSGMLFRSKPSVPKLKREHTEYHKQELMV